MKPYFQTDDGSIRIFHARWEDVLAAGVFVPKDIAFVHADPPYGAGLAMKPDANSRELRRWKKRADKKPIWNDMVGADQDFDPSALLALNRPMVAWGANHYASKMPDSASWLAWDKRDQRVVNDQSDCELAWTNLGGPARMFVYYWNGFSRESEVGAHYHPTQKPEALSDFVFSHAEKRKKLERGDTILIPYMGSFPDARPALVRGYKVIACEVAREYCDTAINARLRSVARPLPHEDLGSLFARKNTP